MSPTSPGHAFRMDLRPVFMFTYVTASIGGTIFILLCAKFNSSGVAIPLHVVLETIGYFIVFYAPVFSAACAVFMSRYYTYSITAKGIGGRNMIGTTRLATWNNISKMRAIRIGNLTFARLVVEEDKLPLWLPLFIHDGETFGGTLMYWAPEDNVTRGLLRRTVRVAA